MFDGFGWEHLQFKDPAFYADLLRDTISGARPEDESSPDFRVWASVRDWAANYAGLRDLTGGALDYLSPADEHERALLDAEMARPQEAARTHFWYNRPYRPRRPMLYQLLSIASGHIPPRTNIVNRIGPLGEVERVSYEAVDDDWLLISTDPSAS